MSHIPSAAMPHAKPHEDDASAPDKPEQKAVTSEGRGRNIGWLAIVAGGAVAVGTAVVAAIALRPQAKPARPRAAPKKTARRKPRKS